jgi:hypothetical protein
MGVNFEDFIRNNRSIVFPAISEKFKTMGLIDLTLLPPEIIAYLIDWILKANRRRIEAGQEIIVTYAIIKQCPIWTAVEMPYRSMKLLGMQKPNLKTVAEQRTAAQPKRTAPIRPVAPIRPKKPM